MTDKTETANMTQRKDITTGQDRQDRQDRQDGQGRKDGKDKNRTWTDKLKNKPRQDRYDKTREDSQIRKDTKDGNDRQDEQDRQHWQNDKTVLCFKMFSSMHKNTVWSDSCHCMPSKSNHHFRFRHVVTPTNYDVT